jgi:putative transposase
MVAKRAEKSLPVRGRAVGRLEHVEAVRSLGDEPLTVPVARQPAERLGVSWRTVDRYRDRLRATDETTALAGRTRGWKPIASRLTAEQDQAIEQAIAIMRKKAAPVRIVDLVEEVSVLCRLKQVPCPSRPAIDRRLKRSGEVKVRRRGVAVPGNADPRISPGTFGVKNPLDVVQIDHTPMDVVVVDDLYRQPLGKPYLTLATDVATRCVVGFVISFVPPGAGTVSLCMTIIVSSKVNRLRELNVEGDWPMAGLPKSLHLDGAAEFKSKALKRGRAQYGIELVYRERPHPPPRGPHRTAHWYENEQAQVAAGRDWRNAQSPPFLRSRQARSDDPQ